MGFLNKALRNETFISTIVQI